MSDYKYKPEPLEEFRSKFIKDSTNEACEHNTPCSLDNVQQTELTSNTESDVNSIEQQKERIEKFLNEQKQYGG